MWARLLPAITRRWLVYFIFQVPWSVGRGNISAAAHFRESDRPRSLNGLDKCFYRPFTQDRRCQFVEFWAFSIVAGGGGVRVCWHFGGGGEEAEEEEEEEEEGDNDIEQEEFLCVYDCVYAYKKLMFMCKACNFPCLSPGGKIMFLFLAIFQEKCGSNTSVCSLYGGEQAAPLRKGESCLAPLNSPSPSLKILKLFSHFVKATWGTR